MSIVVSLNSPRSLWSPSSSEKAIFSASFGHNRFEQLIANLHFDSRENRNMDDMSAPFRRMWKHCFENCKKYYATGSYVTAYEQLLPFQGRCSFRQNMLNKPDNFRLNSFCCVAVSLATHLMVCLILDVNEIKETLGCDIML